MDRQTTLLLALGMLIAAALTVGVSGWVLFVRDRRSSGSVMPPRPRPRTRTITRASRGPECSSSSTCASGGSGSKPSGPRSTPPSPRPSAGSCSASSVEGDEVLIELARAVRRRRPLDRLIVGDDEFARGRARDARRPSRALDALIERLRDLHAPPAPHRVVGGARRRPLRRDRPPLRAVGCYVPGGRAVYPSSVCMTVVPAVVAGVPEIVLCTPPRADGSIPAPVLYAARKAGATYVAKTGRGAGDRRRWRTAPIDPAGRPDRRPRQRVRHRGEAAGRGIVGIDGLAGPERARDRGRRRRRSRARRARPDRAGRARPRCADVPDHRGTRRDRRSRRGARAALADSGPARDRGRRARRTRGWSSSATSTRGRGRGRPGARAPADAARRPRGVPGDGAATPARSSSASGARCRSATTASPRTTSCRPRGPRASPPACAPRTTSPCARWCGCRAAPATPPAPATVGDRADAKGWSATRRRWTPGGRAERIVTATPGPASARSGPTSRRSSRSPRA